MRARLVHALPQLSLLAIVAGSAGLAGTYALQGQSWVVMTDELQAVKLATSIAETLSPLPAIHGERYGPPSQLYPLLLAPLFGLLAVPTAVAAAHALNALLLASAAWPAYLLGRSVTGSRAGGLFAAALTAFVPWLVLASTLLTENAAYPAFAWCIFLVHRTIAAPSSGRDVAALAGLAVAFLARTQLLVLAAVVPVAILVHELVLAVSSAEPGRRRAAAGTAARRAVASHRVLAATYAVAALAAGLLAAAGQLLDVFGTYRAAFRGDLVPPGLWRATAEHLAYVAVGVGIAPFLLAAAWLTTTVIRPRRDQAFAFAVLSIVAIPALAFQVASFNLRFSAGGFVQDRYVCYLAPLLAVGAAGALLEPGRRRLRAALVAAFGLATAALASAATFEHAEVIFWASPASAFHEALASAGRWAGLSADSLVQLAAIGVGAILAAVILVRPGRAALAAAGAVLVAFATIQVVYVFEAEALAITTRAHTIPNVDRDWVDDFVGREASVALVPYAYLPPDIWWDAELWNRSVDRTVEVYGPTYAPFPVDRLSLDLRTGAVRGLPRSLLLMAVEDTRFRLAGLTTVLTTPPLTLVQAPRPHRAEWSTRGADPDGWTRPGRPVRIRFYEAGQPGLREARIAVKAPHEAVGRLRFTVTAGGAVRRGVVAADGVARVSVPVCVPAGGFGEATLTTPAAVRIPDGRVVGLHVDAIEATQVAPRC